MTAVDLRPLTLGEILDRTFSIYRRHFLLFCGFAAVPALLQLGFNCFQLVLFRSAVPNLPLLLGGYLVLLVLFLLAYLVSQGAATLAVTDLYLGRSAGIGKSLRGLKGNVLSLMAVMILNFLVIALCMLALVVPGIYMACRLCVAVPAALVEDRGPREALSRSFSLTRDFAGRAFVIMFMYFVLSFALGALVTWPFLILTFVATRFFPALLLTFQILTQVSSALVSMVVGPFMLIAIAVHYFDLRVRKEAFDLQFMLDPTSERNTRAPGDVPSILG